MIIACECEKGEFHSIENCKCECHSADYNT